MVAKDPGAVGGRRGAVVVVDPCGDDGRGWGALVVDGLWGSCGLCGGGGSPAVVPGSCEGRRGGGGCPCGGNGGGLYPTVPAVSLELQPLVLWPACLTFLFETSV